MTTLMAEDKKGTRKRIQLKRTTNNRGQWIEGLAKIGLTGREHAIGGSRLTFQKSSFRRRPLSSTPTIAFSLHVKKAISYQFNFRENKERESSAEPD